MFDANIETNTIFETKNNGFLVIKSRKGSFVDIMFLDTCTERSGICIKDLYIGVKDHMRPSVEGVGIKGNVRTAKGTLARRAYKRWTSMIRRCYNEDFLYKNPSYKDCSVCEEWLFFPNFLSWFIDNFEVGKDLDKDLLAKGVKVYSPTTCSFITNKENTIIANAKYYRFLSPQGVVHDIYNLSYFCKQNGLDRKNMNAVWKGKRKTCNGWRAMYV